MKTKANFQKLLAQTKKLTETETGKLRGGVAVLFNSQEAEGFNLICYINTRKCKQHTNDLEKMQPDEGSKK